MPAYEVRSPAREVRARWCRQLACAMRTVLPAVKARNGGDHPQKPRGQRCLTRREHVGGSGLLQGAGGCPVILCGRAPELTNQKAYKFKENKK